MHETRKKYGGKYETDISVLNQLGILKNREFERNWQISYF